MFGKSKLPPSSMSSSPWSSMLLQNCDLQLTCWHSSALLKTWILNIQNVSMQSLIVWWIWLIFS